MQNTKTTPLDLGEAEMRLIERYAEEHQMTADQAATALAKQSLANRYVLRARHQPKVIPFDRRRSK